MDAKVLVVFLIVFVLALSTAKKGRHLRRIGGNTLISSYILINFWVFQREFSETMIFLCSGQNLNLSTRSINTVWLVACHSTFSSFSEIITPSST